MKKSIVIVLIALVSLALIAGAAFAATNNKVKQLDIQGSFNEQENDEVNFPLIYLHGNATGTATTVGQYSYHLEGIVYNYDNGQGVAVEGAHITDASGDKIFATGTGLGVPSSTPGINQIEEKYQITGGTGKYLNATGEFTVKRQVTLSTGVSSGTIKGEVALH